MIVKIKNFGRQKLRILNLTTLTPSFKKMYWWSFSLQIFHTSTSRRVDCSRIVALASSNLRHSIHIKIVTHLQRMDVWIERERKQHLSSNYDMVLFSQIIFRLEQANVVQFPGFIT